MSFCAAGLRVRRGGGGGRLIVGQSSSVGLNACSKRVLISQHYLRKWNCFFQRGKMRTELSAIPAGRQAASQPELLPPVHHVGNAVADRVHCNYNVVTLQEKRSGGGGEVRGDQRLGGLATRDLAFSSRLHPKRRRYVPEYSCASA